MRNTSRNLLSILTLVLIEGTALHAAPPLLWTRATAAAAWSGRESHTTVVYDGRMWVIGGLENNPFKNDVWYSTDGANWSLSTAGATWFRRSAHASVVFDGRLWVLGGNVSGTDKNDIWYSTNGSSWTQATSSSGWPGRAYFPAATFDGRMWVIGGRAGPDRNDVWYSTNGSNWTQATTAASWASRDSHTVAVHDGRMWITGGWGGADVWYSTDGANWTQATASAASGQRVAHSMVSYAGYLWLMGGLNGPNLNDVWYSSDGANWTLAARRAGWSPRHFQSSTIFDNKMWVIGGYSPFNETNDVWYREIGDADADGIGDLTDNCPAVANADQADADADGWGDVCDQCPGEDDNDDCNTNDVPDACDIQATTSNDCNNDSIPDECQTDCNTNRFADDCDIAQGTSFDCNHDNVPDECQGDCNTNGYSDECDIADGTSTDCNTNNLPDECDLMYGNPDCNANGSPDECEIFYGSSRDCNGNTFPDDCDINNFGQPDCNTNGVPDSCEPDCNNNGSPDDCDVATAYSQDCNSNGFPDECDVAAPPARYRVLDLGTLGGADSYAMDVNELGQIVGYSSTAGANPITRAFLSDGHVMQDLGTLGGDNSSATAINDQGQVTGDADTGDGQSRAFLWQNGVMTDLGTLGGSWSSPAQRGINASGMVVGNSETSGGGSHPFLWSNGTMTDLGTLGGGDCYANAVNDAGQVVGYCVDTDGYEMLAFLWENGAMTSLGTLGGLNSLAIDINNQGQIAGRLRVNTSRHSVFLWENGVMTDIGTTGGNHGHPNRINELGEIAGESQDISANTRAFFWQNGTMTDLGTLGGNGSNALQLNNRGQILGWADSGSQTGRPMFWEAGTMYDLFDLLPGGHGWDTLDSNDINDAGLIVGGGAHSGYYHAFVMIPLSSDCDGNTVPDECEATARLYVNAAASGANTGQDWANAFTDLQSALCIAAEFPDVVDEVWVAAGVYKPDRGTWDRAATFQMSSSVAIYGGFAGTESNLAERDWNANVTTLSGDLSGDDQSGGSNAENSYHIVTGSGTDGTALLDGFTLTAGNADGSYMDGGGAVYMSNGSATVAHCTFSGNNGQFGGALYLAGGSPVVSHCSIENNTAVVVAGGVMNDNGCNLTMTDCVLTGNVGIEAAGAFQNDNGCSAVVERCRFASNWSDRGGAIYNNSFTSLSFTDCEFTGNSANTGGAIYAENNSPVEMTTCVFRDNEAVTDNGGAIYNYSGTPRYVGCTFSGNSAVEGGGAMYDTISDPEVIDCIFTGNSAGRGGAVQHLNGSGGLFDRCVFNGNETNNGGGAMFIDMSATGVIHNSVFSGNKTMGGYPGGATFIDNDAAPEFVNCLFAGNYGGNSNGGACWNNGPCNPTFFNCTFSRNHTDAGSGGAMLNEVTLASIDNCIFFGNTANTGDAELAQYDGPPEVVFYSLVEGLNALTGNNNIGGDPRFNGGAGGAWTADPGFDAPAGQVTFHDSGAAWVPGEWAGRLLNPDTTQPLHFWITGNTATTITAWADSDTVSAGQSWVSGSASYQIFNPRLRSDSPCIDAGNNDSVPSGITTDLDGNARFVDHPTSDTGGGTPPIVDMGAFEVLPDCNGNGLTDAGEAAARLYVDVEATGTGSGQNWADAYTDLQSALCIAAAYPDVVNEIWAAEGTYRPDVGGGHTSGDRDATFHLVSSVAIYGGFAGGETDLSQRDPDVHVCTLTGDVNGDDTGEWDDASRLENIRQIVTGTGTDSTAILDGFTIRSGTTEANGPGLLCEPGHPSIARCIFSNHVSYNIGGAIYLNGSHPTFTQCRFDNNSGGDGGGIMLNDLSDPVFTDCTFSGNTARTCSGGGILISNGSNPQFTRCALSGNHAFCDGGGAFAEGTMPIFDTCTFDSNLADQFGGGLVMNSGAVVSLTDCAFTGNQAPNAVGGGIYASGATPQLLRCTLTGNTARDGAGMWNEGDAGGSLTDCDFTSNTGIHGGAGIYHMQSSPTLTRCTFTSNTTDEDHGGGMYNDTLSNPVLTDCTFTTNTAFCDGGGVHNEADSSPSFTRCTFTGNTTPCTGGGMSNLSGCNPTLIECSFTHNTAQDGGGMFNNGSSPTLTDCTFSDNTGSDGTGGGMSNTASSSPALTNCAFNGNAGTWGGGGMWNESGSNATLTNCSFSNNRTDDGGGGMGNYNAAPSVTNCTFTGNQANLNGEHAGGYGGGMINYFAGSGSATVTNCVFLGNSALLGGGVHNFNASPILTNCTFSGNTATDAHGGMYSDSNSSPTATNCIFWGDTPGEIGEDSSTTTVTYSCVQGGWSGTGNIDADPRFFDAPGGNVRLLSASPCLDAGDNSAVPGDVTTDLAGGPRFLDNPAPDTGNGSPPIVDMGAYEMPADCNGNGLMDDTEAAARLYVNAGATGANSGQTWADAYTDLQSALCIAAAHPETVDEIWVATGVYRPDRGTLDQFVTFQLVSGVAVYGGFAGGESAIGERNIWTNVTILSGDLAGDDGPSFANNTENSYHITTGSGTDSTAILDGFTIRGGFANGPSDCPGPYQMGAGMYNDSGSPTLVNCTIIENMTSGGNCNGSYGAGMYNLHSSPTLINCIIHGNVATEGLGAGVCNESSSPTLINCVISANWARYGAGGMYNERADSFPTLINCTFSGNSTGDNGSGGLQPGGGLYNEESIATVTNCVLWGNYPNDIFFDTGNVTIAYSDVRGSGGSGSAWWTGLPVTDAGGNIDADPRFVVSPGNLRLRTGSPCIDAGGNAALPMGVTTDVAGGPRFLDDPTISDTGSGTPPISDMGAYEFLLDCNNNGIVDTADIGVISTDCNGNATPDECELADGLATDCNNNGTLDACDIAILASADCNGNQLPDECEAAGWPHASFRGLGDLPGGPFDSAAGGVSPDGWAVAGYSQSANGYEAFLWTPRDGMIPMGDLPKGSFESAAYGASSRGEVFAGYASDDVGYQGFRWTRSGGMEGLGRVPGGSYSDAYKVSNDGTYIIGTTSGPDGQDLYRWSQGSGMMLLPPIPGGYRGGEAHDISSDGSYVSGWGITDEGGQALRWHEGDGTMALGGFPDVGPSGQGHGMSPEGGVVVGGATSLNGSEGFRWSSATGVVGLGDLPGGDFYSYGESVSANGRRIIGTSSSAAGYEPFLWDAEHGMRSIRDMLINDYGLTDLNNWTLTQATQISDDGTVIVGAGLNPNGDYEAWVAVIPYPPAADCNANTVPDTCDVAAGQDCNGNQVPDACDIAQGTSLDSDNSNIPDECELPTELRLVFDSSRRAAADCIQPGSGTNEILAVTVRMTGAHTPITGGQFFLTYNNTALQFVSARPGDEPFVRQVYESVDEGLGQITYATGILDEGSPTSSDTTMAILLFRALTEDCATSSLVRFSDGSEDLPPTRLSTTGDSGVEATLVNLAAITMDYTAPVLTAPGNISVHSDAGQCQVTFSTLPMATATDNCDSAPAVTFLRSDGKPNLLDAYAAADSPITLTWRAEDDCGNITTAAQVITVSGSNVMTVAVELSPTLDDLTFDPDFLNRCIRFELWACPGGLTPAATVDQVLTFPMDGGAHVAAGVPVLVPCGDYNCVTARDRLHTLRSKAPDFTDNGATYSGTFTGDRSAGGHWLIGGNLNDDRFIDILDFGSFVVRFQSSYDSDGNHVLDGNTTCATPFFHADITGDGLVFTGDFTFIQVNFLKRHDTNCCSRPGVSSGESTVMSDAATTIDGQPVIQYSPRSTAQSDAEDALDQPIRSISVAELWRRGLGDLAAADLNQDGVLDEADMDVFAKVQSPGSAKQPLRSLRAEVSNRTPTLNIEEK